jgi:hypothetical protein
MINKIVSKIKDISKSSCCDQLGIILFIFGYNAIMLVFFLLIGEYLVRYYLNIEMPTQIFYELVIGIILLKCFAVSCIHALFIKRYTSLRYEIYKAKSDLKNIAFMFVCLSIAMLACCAFGKFLINRTSFWIFFYITQNISYYLLLKVKWFEHNIVQRSKILSA